MTGKKKVVTAIAVTVLAAAVGVGGFFAWKKLSADSENSAKKVYVQKVSDLNTAGGFDLSMTKYSAVVEAQASSEVKYDTTKTIDEILVKEGDSVKKGDKLLTYDIESIDLQLEQANLEAERLQAQIDSNNAQIKELENEKKNASADAVVSYNTQILSLQSENAANEYDKKTKEAEAAKLEKSKDKAYIVSPADGTVANLKAPGSSEDESSDVIMKITAEGAYRVKGKVNEQNVRMLYEGCPMIMRSRVDDTVMRGSVSKIETKPVTEQGGEMGYDMYDMGGGDDGYSSSSNYAFYVEPDDPDQLMLGQHLLLEVDNGQDEAIEKEGIWLYKDFVVTKDGESFVWAADEDGKMEKRSVSLGKEDEAFGDVEIKSGLKESDKIAFPSSYIKEGMTATTNENDVSIEANDLDEGGDEMIGDKEYGYDDTTDPEDPFAGLTEEELAQMTDEELGDLALGADEFGDVSFTDEDFAPEGGEEQP